MLESRAETVKLGAPNAMAVSQHAQAPRSLMALPEELKRAIANGEYAPGAKLVERELALKYGVGRTAVRDALRYLDAERIIVLTENRGARIRELSYAEAADIYQVRSVLEGLAGELFAVRGTAAEKVVFAKSLEPVREAMENLDITGALLASDVYYSHLLNGARNFELYEVVERLHVRISQLRRVSLSMSDRAQATIESLQRIVNAVLAGDPVEARLACVEHVRAAAAATLPVLAATGEKPDAEPKICGLPSS
ncbi:GntR family transcriptional regulator [Arthrobacter sp. MMS18-M83]|uniref:GntR family transcriptional regulator n=1 Tax=Arthrobacter sp. MMS18-M83 TaxID=2996261 RepID=UPI00227C7050|nr:GntR family transcriptional regulator [Arthrobacter sp. MMS18-M83]WAH97472.1 GntR family transcriptional regulator [Arthrobacter sp. MMS18-M83]